MRNFLLLVFLFITVTANAEVYQWKDKDGNLCFGESPPDNVEIEKVIEIKETTGVNSTDSFERLNAEIDAERQKREVESQKRMQEWDLEFEKRIAHDTEERETYVSKHPDLSENIKNAILNCRLCIGMTKDEVYLCWGTPSDTNRTVSASGTHEQLVYKKRGYVYMENGILTSWQESE